MRLHVNYKHVTYPVFRGELDVQLLNQLLCLLLLEVHNGVKDLEGGRGREEGGREEGGGRREEEGGRREEGGGREEEKRGGRGRKGNNRTMQLSFKVSVTIPV